MGTIATKSKKAARIESALLNKLALMGQKTFARAMGVAGAGLASLLETSTPWGAGIGAGIGLLGSLF